MCFTVAIVREGKLITAEEYYVSKPPVKQKKVIFPELPFHYLVSSFSHPSLPVISAEGLSLFDWGLIPAWVKDQETANDKSLCIKYKPFIDI